MVSAIAISDWFANEDKRVYGVLSEPDEARQVRRLLEIVRRSGGQITPRDLRRATRQFHSTEEAEAALEDMVKAGLGKWGQLLPTKYGGRPTRVFQIVDSVDIDETA
jgi:hypothetical protein